MDFSVTSHAIERMKKYSISSNLLKDTLQKPDSVEKSYKERAVYQKKLNGHVKVCLMNTLSIPKFKPN